MKVLQVNKAYPPVIGGIERHLEILSRGLARSGVEVQVLVCNHRFRTEIMRENGYEVIKAAGTRPIASMHLGPTTPLWYLRCKPDLIHIHLPYPMGEVATWLTRPRVPVLATWHSDIVRQKRMVRVYNPMRRWFLRFAARVIVTSQRLLDNTPILQPFREKCSIVPLGIDLGRFAPTPAVEEKARRLRERFPGPIVLFIGRLIPYKGLEYLIPAMKGVEANLLIIGEGRLHGELEEITRKHGLESQVHFQGAVSDESVVAHVYASDCLVLPSVMSNEAFGIVQLEAMVCGKPVICSDLPTGVPYVNQHEKTGLVVPPRDTKAIREALLRLLGNDVERKTFGENARRRVYEEFGAELMVSRVLGIYNEVLSK